ncbi:MAG: response regulator [Candidatus Binatia bacterium]|jgi:CheY-like chemotaxis protein
MAENKKTILIVEDEPDTVTYLSTLFGDAGYDTVAAEDGDQALEKVKASPPDLITLDITMPHKSGVRFYRDMKESEKWKSIPIIIVTGISTEFERFISTRRQVPPPEGYLSKPVDREKMLTMVKQHLGS